MAEKRREEKRRYCITLTDLTSLPPSSARAENCYALLSFSDPAFLSDPFHPHRSSSLSSSASPHHPLLSSLFTLYLLPLPSLPCLSISSMFIPPLLSSLLLSLITVLLCNEILNNVRRLAYVPKSFLTF